MSRPSATAALLLLVLSLVAVAHCRTLGADHDTEPESTSVVAVSDENGLSSNPTVPAEAGTGATEEVEEGLPAEQHHVSEFQRLLSHRLHHHPCSLHHHLWWKRHHGIYHDAPRRFRDHYSGHGESREVKPVAEPDPDRSLPGSDGEVELVARREPSFADGHDDEPVAAFRAWKKEVLRRFVAEPDPDRTLPDRDGEVEVVASKEPSFADGHDDEPAAAVRAWRKEMLRRWLHFHFHHGMRRHHLHHVHHDEEEEEEAAPVGMMNMKRFHFHHHDDEEDEEKNMVRKRLRHSDAEHGEDRDDEDEQVEEMVRRFIRKAIMRRRFGHGHGRRFFHHLHHKHSHRHAEETEKQAGGEEESSVVAWIKRLMNCF